MKHFLITMAGVFAGLVIFRIGIPFVLVAMAAGAAGPAPLPAHAVLQLDLRETITDQDPGNPLVSLGRRSLSVMSVIEALKRAETDGRVRGVLVRLPEGGMEPGAADELRLAFLRLRVAGKPVFAHSQGVYPSAMAPMTYMLGASADELWMQPGATLQATGISTEDVFLKRFFDKYGVVADFEQRYEYKNAVNGYLQDDYTAAHKESQLSWMTSVYESAINSAARDRKQAPAVLRANLEAGPYAAEQARANGLIDKVGQVREAEQALLKRAGDNAEMVDFGDYQRARKERDHATRSVGSIAVIEAEGPIVTGRDGGANPFQGGSTVYSDDVSEAFYDAAKAKDVKAIVFRVNSPGGSDTASEQILAGVRAAKAAGKPVVVSMGTYGASGGYWIASEASSIVAEPTTLTGSIGVFGGKFALGPALARYGVDLRETQVGGAYADAFSMGKPFTTDDRAAFAGWMDRIYDNFVARVAVGRKLSPERVREIAKGRVWTGAQAHELGLVDHVGGFYEAVEQARVLAKLEGVPHLKRMSPSASPLEALQQALGVSATSMRTLAAAAWVMGDPKAQAVMDELASARMRSQGALVLAPMPIR
ncbi:MAG: signal peptide peptidase SppA [Phenylobacterium sp.]|uniref:signal peptide peptidase SppA n=1 Tax=Phenylobacterium sp. TaxID=1871053 RepID=UPI002736E833|nr:signal peptide peptidase SppA [Phenylobacterium sp.]MDP3174939.1 signal peptide peptidase SppA [Phenylobacterium sp.]